MGIQTSISGIRLTGIRKSKGITQKQLADNSGVNIRQIQRIESGGSDMGNVTLKNAVAIADALGVDVKMFVEE